MACRAAALVGLAAAAAAAGAQQPATVHIAGHLIGWTGTHDAYVALWNDSTFLHTPIREIKLPAGGDSTYTFDVAAGKWALSAYEDRNENGKLDMGLFGPKEPAGFWRAFHGWHKPWFRNVAVDVTADMSDANVKIR
ncbi:MAG TPA: DUF2141 domain-containing protein [Gemmatimonadaceae bacterium]|nr:DUF2141 domain-containing protein [Gemmatimonadaceae bacterium]